MRRRGWQDKTLIRTEFRSHFPNHWRWWIHCLIGELLSSNHSIHHLAAGWLAKNNHIISPFNLAPPSKTSTFPRLRVISRQVQICAVNAANGVRQTGETAGLDGLDAFVAPPLEVFQRKFSAKTKRKPKIWSTCFESWFTRHLILVVSGCLRYLVKVQVPPVWRRLLIEWYVSGGNLEGRIYGEEFLIHWHTCLFGGFTHNCTAMVSYG